MEAGFEFIVWLATELFGDIVAAGKPWWIKLLASLGCLAAFMLLGAAIL